MPEPVDIYSDQFQITIGPYGCVLNFSATSPEPSAPGSPRAADRLASVRMSNEHLKVLTYVLRRQVLDYERRMGVRVPVPHEVLNALRVGPEDWEAFWAPGEPA
jgi:hypothetical protein